MRDNVLVAQPFDPERLTLSGEPRPIAENVAVQSGTENALVWCVYRLDRRSRGVRRRRSARGISGSRGSIAPDAKSAAIGEAGNFTNASLSADGRRAAVTLPEPNRSTSDIWVVDLARGVRNRLTGPEGDEQSAVWTPDGTRIIFSSRRPTDPQFAVYARAPAGAGSEELPAE